MYDILDSAARWLHSLATRREPAVKGCGRKMLEWAGNHARRHNLEFVRLDCWSKNEALKAYYRSCGYDYIDDVPQTDGETHWFASRFQKRVTVAVR